MMNGTLKLTSKQTYPLQMKALLFMISALGIASVVKEELFPNSHLTIILGIAIVTDFLSGVVKSMANNQQIVSHKLQRTTLKISRYGLTIIVSFILRSIASDNGATWRLLGSLLNNGVLLLMIYTEVVSVLENIIAINNDDLISTRIAKPLHALITFKFHNGISELLYKKFESDHRKNIDNEKNNQS